MSLEREKRKLRLRAEDAEDLAILAAILQDARAPLTEMAYDREARRFMVSFLRYMRECQPDPCDCDGLCEIQSVVVFDDIEDVRHRGLDTDDPARPLSLLTIATHPGRERLVDIDLVFAGGGTIRLASDRIRCRLEDHGEPRPCEVPPDDHFADERGEEAGAGPSRPS
jgi:hypothetical protein